MDLCKYKDIFGAPNTGSHRYRIFNIAIIDVIATIIVAFIINKTFKTNFAKTLFILFLLGIVSHRMFCVRTTVDKLLFY
jgi:hypothetical protein